MTQGDETMPVQVPDYEEFTTLVQRVDGWAEAVTGLSETVSEQSGVLNTLGLQVDELSAKVDDLADAVAGLGSGSVVVTPEQYGARPGADATQAFRDMFADINARMRTDAGGSVAVASVTVQLSGVYTVSDTVMLPVSRRAQGLTIRGIGKRSSEIVMTAAKPLLSNRDQWMGVTFENLSFRSTNSGASCIYAWSSSGANQDWNFVRCEWRGQWAYGIGLDGNETSNCNSEWVFDRCTVTGSYETAWLWSGMSPQYPQQDQFLNFGLRDCKVELAYGDALRFDKGGSITVSGGSWIYTSARSSGAASRFFYFPAGSHYDSVQNLTVQGVRFEPRNVANKVIESNWKGMVQFIGCMDDAWAFKAEQQASTYFPHVYTNPGGVRYQGCAFTGRHSYVQSAAPSRQSIVYAQCARTAAPLRTRAAFYSVTGSSGPSVNIVCEHDRDGIV